MCATHTHTHMLESRVGKETRTRFDLHFGGRLCSAYPKLAPRREMPSANSWELMLPLPLRSIILKAAMLRPWPSTGGFDPEEELEAPSGGP